MALVVYCSQCPLCRWALPLVGIALEDEAETEAERFDADFVIMTQSLQQLVKDLLEYLTESVSANAAEAVTEN